MSAAKIAMENGTELINGTFPENAKKTTTAEFACLPETANGPKPSEAMSVNTVKPLEDTDYEYAKNLCDDERPEQWQLVFQKKHTRVWTSCFTAAKKLDGESEGGGGTLSAMLLSSSLQMVKAKTVFADVSAEQLFDVLQDPAYRHKWDKYMLKQETAGYINPNNDICYYALGALPPFRSRDFVVQRSWLDLGTEKFILAHSVWHDRFAPTKAHIRGVVFLTAFFIRSLPNQGCEFNYLTYSDPKGKLPSWLINRVTTIIAPKLLKKLHKACQKYPEWCQKHEPGWQHGVFHNISDYQRIDLSECIPPKENGADQASIVDETKIQEKDVTASDEKDDEDATE